MSPFSNKIYPCFKCPETFKERNGMLEHLVKEHRDSNPPEIPNTNSTKNVSQENVIRNNSKTSDDLKHTPQDSSNVTSVAESPGKVYSPEETKSKRTAGKVKPSHFSPPLSAIIISPPTVLKIRPDLVNNSDNFLQNDIMSSLAWHRAEDSNNRLESINDESEIPTFSNCVMPSDLSEKSKDLQKQSNNSACPKVVSKFSDLGKFPCFMCPESFEIKVAMLHHIKADHDVDVSAALTNVNISTPHDAPHKTDSIEDDDAESTTENIVQINSLSINSKTTNIVYPCFMCLETFQEKQAMNVHVLNLHGICLPSIQKSKEIDSINNNEENKNEVKKKISPIEDSNESLIKAPNGSSKTVGRPKKLSAGKQKIFPCYNCDYKSKERMDMMKHLQEVHNIDTDTVVTSNPGRPTPKTISPAKTSPAKKSETLEKKISPSKNPIKVGNKRTFPCYICSNKSTDRKEMLNHLRSVHEVDVDAIQQKSLSNDLPRSSPKRTRRTSNATTSPRVNSEPNDQNGLKFDDQNNHSNDTGTKEIVMKLDKVTSPSKINDIPVPPPTKPIQEKTFPCHECDFKSSDRLAVHQHLQNEHAIDTQTIIGQQKTQKLQLQTSDSNLTPNKAIESQRTAFLNKAPSPSFSSIRPSKKFGPQVKKVQSYPCYICRVQSNDKDEMLKHLQTIHNVDTDAISSKAKDTSNQSDTFVTNKPTSATGKHLIIKGLPIAQERNKIQNKANNRIEMSNIPTVKNGNLANVQSDKNKKSNPSTSSGSSTTSSNSFPKDSIETGSINIGPHNSNKATSIDKTKIKKIGIKRRSSDTESIDMIKDKAFGTTLTSDHNDSYNPQRNESNHNENISLVPIANPSKSLINVKNFASETRIANSDNSIIENPSTARFNLTDNNNLNSITKRSFPCYLCKYSANEREILLSHLKLNHDVDTEAIISKKKKKVSNPENQATHDNKAVVTPIQDNQSTKIHKNEQKKPKAYPCYKCAHQSTSREDMLCHLEATHGIDTRSILNQNSSKKTDDSMQKKTSPESRSMKPAKSTECNLCGFKTSSDYALADHIKNHHGEKEVNDNEGLIKSKQQKAHTEKSLDKGTVATLLEPNNECFNGDNLIVSKDHDNNEIQPTAQNEMEKIGVDNNQNKNRSTNHSSNKDDVSENGLKEESKEIRKPSTTKDSNLDTEAKDGSEKVENKESKEEHEKPTGNLKCYMCDNYFDDIQDMMAHLVDDHQIAPKAKKSLVPKKVQNDKSDKEESVKDKES